MGRKTVEVVDQARGLGGVDLDRVRGEALPVRGEDDDGFGLDAGSDFAADALELGVDGVRGGFHYVRAAVGEEVDGCAGHGRWCYGIV